MLLKLAVFELLHQYSLYIYIRLKNNLPGNRHVNQGRINPISRDAISDEKEVHIHTLDVVKLEFENHKILLEPLFSQDAASKEI